jgi:hypothetical protein
MIASVVLETTKLKKVLKEVEALLTKTALSKTVSFIIDEAGLQVRSSAVVEYVSKIESSKIKGIGSGFFIFEKFDEVLDGRKETVVTIYDQFIEVCQEDSRIHLMTKDSYMPELPQDDGNGYSVIDGLKLSTATTTLQKLGPVSGLFKKGFNILFQGGNAQVRFPTMWVQCISDGLFANLSSNVVYIIPALVSESDEVKIKSTDGYVALTNGRSTIYIPTTKNEESIDISQMISGYNKILSVKTQGLVATLVRLQKAVGKVDCKMVFTNDNVTINVVSSSVSVEKEVSFQKDTGETNTEEVFDVFETRIEFLLSILSITGQEFDLYKGQGVRAIVTPDISVLFSVM